MLHLTTLLLCISIGATTLIDGAQAPKRPEKLVYLTSVDRNVAEGMTERTWRPEQAKEAPQTRASKKSDWPAEFWPSGIFD